MAAVHTSIPRATRYRFADLTLDLGQRRVARDGQALHLGKLTYEMLVTLVEAAPNVVTQDEFVARVWNGRIATPETVAQRLKLLREALGDEPAHPRYIAVLRGQGCRLIPPVEPDPVVEASAAAGSAPEPSPATARVSQYPDSATPDAGARASSLRRARLSFAIAAVVAAAGLAAIAWYLRDREPSPAPPATATSVPVAKTSIAVLPFADMSAAGDQQYLSDGIAEEILDRLANAGDLRVIARTSSFSFRDRPLDIPQIAQRLNVSHVLEGSVRRSGERVRITVQLVEGASASHLWSATYERELGELFAVQDEIASSVAAALQVALAEDAPAGAEPVSAEAQDDYLHGRFFYDRRAEGDIERAVRHFEAAVEREPRFARAWAALSGAYALMWWTLNDDSEDWRAKQGEAAKKAVDADPLLLDAHLRLGQYYFDTSNLERAREQLRKAAKLDPDNLWLATFARGVVPWHRIDMEQQLERERTAVQNDPLSVSTRWNYALTLFAAGQLDEALFEFQRVIELSPEANWDKLLEIPRVLVAQERYADAQTAIARLPAEARDYGLAMLYHAPGRRAEADAALARLQARSGDYMHGIRVAETLALRGEKAAAFAALRKARDELRRDEAILLRLWFFQHEMYYSPFLRPLRADARFQSLVAQPEGDSAEEIIDGLWPRRSAGRR